jgi:hypothetical protein
VKAKSRMENIFGSFLPLLEKCVYPKLCNRKIQLHKRLRKSTHLSINLFTKWVIFYISISPVSADLPAAGRLFGLPK